MTGHIRQSQSVAESTPAVCYSAHTIGRLTVNVNNTGWFSGNNGTDCFSGLPLGPAVEFPKYSQISYVDWLSLWVGAPFSRDTLVSIGITQWYEGPEFWPDQDPGGRMIRRSILDPNSPEYIGAISQQDLIATYTDTYKVSPSASYGEDWFRKGPHRPIGIEVIQRSYAWSYPYAEDFVLFDFSISNISARPIRQGYLGVDFSPGIGYVLKELHSADDVVGFVTALPSNQCLPTLDTFRMVWMADNDGDPIDGQFQDVGGAVGKSCTGVVGLELLGPSIEDKRLSFNWWRTTREPRDDFAPRRRGTAERPFRDFQTGRLGTPSGDINKYYVMSSGEIDYDQAYTASISPVDLTWMAPPQSLDDDIADGTWSEGLVSFGPYDIVPGAAVNFAFAVVAGERFHTDPNNLSRLQAGDVHGYYDHLDLSDLAKNAMWAKWIYDNPGVDTDGDGYAGKQRICVFDSQYVDSQWVPLAAETTFYEGDGIPDWRGASPPPAPTYWIHPGYNSIRVRFNGHRSETTKDIFSGIIDFEGYRIYFGRDEREGSLSLIGSYDHENFDKYVYNLHKQPEAGFEIQEIPLTLDQIRCAYGNGAEPCTDSLFNPLDYGDPAHLFSPQSSPDSFFYFTVHDYNASVFGVTTEIRKIYPNEPKPSSFDTLRPEQLTNDGHMKYYEYEFTIRDLLASVPYYVNVTAFDFGSPKGNLKALETSKTVNIKHCYPAGTPQLADGSDKRVYVYPNPYRIDAEYRAKGYEGRMREDRPDDRVRLIHFANLPPKCTIGIYSLDGDLVRKLNHDMDPSDPNSSHDTWDLITRNTQLTVSGIYYWAVEDERGNVQIGKLVVIM